MDIKNVRSGPPENHYNSENVADASSVVLELKKKKVKIDKSKIKSIAGGLAEVAYSMGETNNPDAYAELITEDILQALKKVKKRQEEKKKKRHNPLTDDELFD